VLKVSLQPFDMTKDVSGSPTFVEGDWFFDHITTGVRFWAKRNTGIGLPT